MTEIYQFKHFCFLSELFILDKCYIMDSRLYQDTNISGLVVVAECFNGSSKGLQRYD